MRLGKTTLIHFASNVAVSATGFVATFAIAFLLGPAGLGEYAVATALGFFWLAIPANAVETAIRKRISEGIDRRAFFGTGLIVNGVIGLLLAAGVVAAGVGLPLLIDPGQNEFLRVLTTYAGPISLLVLGTYGYKTVTAGLQGQKRVASSGVLKAAERLGRTILQVGVLILGYGVTALVLGHVASLAIAGIIGLGILGLRPAKPTREHFESVAEFAKYAWMGALRSRVFGWMDTLILALFVSASLIGIYEAAWGIASLLAAVSGSIQRTLFPEVSEISVEAAYDRVKHYLDEGLVFAGIFIIPGFAGAVVIGERVLAFYRPEFTQGTEILLLLVLAYGFEVYGSQFVNVINAVDRPRTAYRVNLAFIVTNLILNIVLIWSIGWYGAAIATAASALLRMALGYRALYRIIGRPSVPVREIGLEVLAAVGMAIVVLGAKPYAVPGRIGTLELVSIGVLTYVPLLLVLSTRVRRKTRSLLPTSII